MLLSTFKFHVNQCSEDHTLFRDVCEIVAVFSKLLSVFTHLK